MAAKKSASQKLVKLFRIRGKGPLSPLAHHATGKFSIKAKLQKGARNV